MQILEEYGFFDISAVIRSGIYALVWKDEIVYIGQSGRLFVRLYTHCNDRWKMRKVKLGQKVIKGVVFDAIWALPVPEHDLDRVERELIFKFQPRYNEHHKLNPSTKLTIEELMAVIETKAPPAPVEQVVRIRRRV